MQIGSYGPKLQGAGSSLPGAVFSLAGADLVTPSPQEQPDPIPPATGAGHRSRSVSPGGDLLPPAGSDVGTSSPPV